MVLWWLDTAMGLLILNKGQPCGPGHAVSSELSYVQLPSMESLLGRNKQKILSQIYAFGYLVCEKLHPAQWYRRLELPIHVRPGQLHVIKMRLK